MVQKKKKDLPTASRQPVSRIESKNLTTDRANTKQEETFCSILAHGIVGMDGRMNGCWCEILKIPMRSTCAVPTNDADACDGGNSHDSESAGSRA